MLKERRVMSGSILQIVDSTGRLDSGVLESLRAELVAIIGLGLGLANEVANGVELGRREIGRRGLGRREIELVFVEEQEMRALNAEYLGRDYATDVLSFPLAQEWGAEADSLDLQDCGAMPLALGVPCAPLGSIIINLPLCVRMSEELGHTLVQEICLLFAHALLHLLGFDHERDNGEHRALESTLITLAKLPPSLIDRNS